MQSNPSLKAQLEAYFQGCLYLNFSRLHRRLDQIAQERFKALDLAPTQAFMILALAEAQNDPVSPSMLAEVLQLDRSTVTRLLDSLCTRQLIYRLRRGREMHLKLTSKGEALIGPIEDAWSKLYDDYSRMFGLRMTEVMIDQSHSLRGLYVES